MSKKNEQTKKTSKNVCPPCAPVWPAVLLAVIGTGLIVLSGWQVWGKNRVREKVVKEECAHCVETGPHDRLQARVPAAVSRVGNSYVFTAPNGVKIDLPRNTAGELAYEVEAQYVLERTGDQFHQHEVVSYLATMRHDPENYNDYGLVSPIVWFSIDYTDEARDATPEGGEELITVQYLGQTRGGQSILLVEGETSGAGYVNTPIVSSLKRADLRATNYLIKTADLWQSFFIESGDGSGSTWSLMSNRDTGEMSEAELADVVKILSSVR
ncbi:hypothetical protein FWG86_02340 [Candidatus Saccharibacteria bacterium]|nr:hypothetical protein [Candidatus Saccharibacteria bacterium]